MAKSDEPKLLAGGNPQIPKGDGDAPVQAFIAAMPDWKHAIGRDLDRLVEEVVPGVRKAVRWNSPFYGVEGHGWFLGFHCLTKYVKVAFLNGGSLDPLPPEPSKDPNTLYVHLRDGDPVDTPDMRRWISQAAAIPGWDGF